jgi:deazaflavin-dependent oxidoreductase (nitroreductase family)
MAAVKLSPALRMGWWMHRTVYRLSGGRIGRRVNGFEVLLLTTVGRTSGEPRRAALQMLPHGDAFAVIASHAGDARHPAWWLNLRARPEADAQVGRRRFRVRAREATGAERDDLWARFVVIDDAYAEYARRTEGIRIIPVVVLEPVRGA